LVAAASLLLGGCESIGSYWDGSSGTSAYPPAVMASAAPEVARNTSCEDAALKRSGDAAAQDFDESVQQTVYRETYANCLKWAALR
jgi:hypothetical protein